MKFKVQCVFANYSCQIEVYLNSWTWKWFSGKILSHLSSQTVTHTERLECSLPHSSLLATMLFWLNYSYCIWQREIIASFVVVVNITSPYSYSPLNKLYTAAYDTLEILTALHRHSNRVVIILNFTLKFDTWNSWISSFKFQIPKYHE